MRTEPATHSRAGLNGAATHSRTPGKRMETERTDENGARLTAGIRRSRHAKRAEEKEKRWIRRNFTTMRWDGLASVR